MISNIKQPRLEKKVISERLRPDPVSKREHIEVSQTRQKRAILQALQRKRNRKKRPKTQPYEGKSRKSWGYLQAN